MSQASPRSLLGRVAGLLKGSVGSKGPSSSYMHGGRSTTFHNWFPMLRDAREDVRAAYVFAAARTIDLIQNSGWLAGAVSQATASTIGTGLRLAAKPDFASLGWTQANADTWSRQVERRWEAWARNPLECDAAGKWNMAKIAHAGLRSYFATGEIVALVPWVTRPESRTRTKLQLVPSYRLVQNGNGVDLFQGVRVDKTGLPVGYQLRLTTPILDTGQILEIQARDKTGRPSVLHIFDGDIGQMRGISPLTPVLRVAKQFDQLGEATLAAALIQAIFAATIRSPAPTADVLQALQSEGEQDAAGQGQAPTLIDGYLGAKADWYDNAKIDLGGLARIAHLFPGEELDFKKSETPNSNYEAFAKFMLREIARCLGVSYETVSGDYTAATYSSVRMSTSENWPLVLWRREHVASPIYQNGYECWLEEDIEAGLTPFPGGLEAFLANKSAACRADWRGPPKPQADDLKYAKAVEVLAQGGWITDEQICSDLGTDWEETYEQRKREKDKRSELGLPDPSQPPDDPMSDKLVAQPE